MKLISIGAGAVAAMALAGCASSSGPRIVSANQAGVTYRVAADNVDSAKAAAEEYCQKRGLRAVLDRVTPDGKNAVASFYCVR